MLTREETIQKIREYADYAKQYTNPSKQKTKPTPIKNKKDHRKRMVLNYLKNNDLCQQCGVKMIHSSQVKGKKQPDNLATYEHVISRNNPERGKKFVKNKVICFRCNQNNNIDEQSKGPKTTSLTEA